MLECPKGVFNCYCFLIMLSLLSLGSGSSGNSAVVYSENSYILVDAGLSAMQLKKRIKEGGLDPQKLDAVIITHEHSDHIRGLEVLSKTINVPVYCNSLTHEAMVSTNGSVKSWNILNSGESFMVGDINVCGFSVMHDAVDPLGFRFKKNEKTLGFISDVGHVTQLLLESIKDVHTLFIESNYDEILLQNDTRRPWSLKQRIASRHGHLSNKQTADLIGSIAEGGLLKSVILGHLSNDCNSPEVARAEVILALSNRGVSEVEVNCASRSEISGPYIIEIEVDEEGEEKDLEGYAQEEFPLFS